MKKIGIIGHFAFGKKMLDGQTLKTKILAEVLQKKLGEDCVSCVDTHGGAKKLFRIIFSIPGLLKKSSDVIMLPAHNGLLVITPVLSFFNKFTKKNLHYVVIGGWLPEYLGKHKFIAKLLRKNFKGIYVETTVMEKSLLAMGFNNIHILPNYKDIEPMSEEFLTRVEGFPVKLCYFSRVTEMKGIVHAVEVVKELNSDFESNVVTLDIFGQVDDSYKSDFSIMMNDAPEYIVYRGGVDFDKTVETLHRYDLQLFPTMFKTEGIPGSVIESYFAGTPVVASRWNSYCDVVTEGVTGVGFEIGKYSDFKEKLQELILDFDKINEMKRNCIREAWKYRAECIKSIDKYWK